jgi:hypothetical protein
MMKSNQLMHHNNNNYAILTKNIFHVESFLLSMHLGKQSMKGLGI